MARPVSHVRHVSPEVVVADDTSLSIHGPIHHIGIITDDLDGAIESYRKLGFHPGEEVRLEDQNVDVVPIEVGGSWIELLAPLDYESGLGRFLQSRGPGMHHVAYLVEDLDAYLDALAARGVELIDEKSRIGLHGWKVAFVHPRSCGGVLTELIERASTMGH